MRRIQQSGGTFLLLLEEREPFDYLVPVAGANGIVPLSGGTVDMEVVGKEKTDYFVRFLRENSPIMTYQTSSFNSLFLRAGFTVITLIALFLTIWFGSKAY